MEGVWYKLALVVILAVFTGEINEYTESEAIWTNSHSIYSTAIFV